MARRLRSVGSRAQLSIGRCFGLLFACRDGALRAAARFRFQAAVSHPVCISASWYLMIAVPLAAPECL
jgi:hypothetical protein